MDEDDGNGICGMCDTRIDEDAGCDYCQKYKNTNNGGQNDK